MPNSKPKSKSKKEEKSKSTKYIFVVGGVMSGVGKGVTTASIGQILQSRGYKVSAMKMDPYINVDAGTMNPVEHGEVFVTSDGDETDQDIGNYERFLNKDIFKTNYMTTGRVYKSVIEKERNLEYKGKCVQVVPHIPQEIRDRIYQASLKTEADIMIIEIGGTVGEYENLLFLEAARVMKHYSPDDVLFVMVSYIPMPKMIGEMKTKPTQHAVRSLQSAGIQPNFLIARSEKAIDKARRDKLSINCNLLNEDVISAPDDSSIYNIPLNFENLLFLEAARVMKHYRPDDVLFVMVSYIPMPKMIGEMKTKPTQHAVRSLQSAGIQPNFLIARSEKAIDKARRDKLSINCNLLNEDVISAPDDSSIYNIPLNFEKDNLGDRILEKLKLPVKEVKNNEWKKMVERGKRASKEVKIGIVGKYFKSGDFAFGDSYISVIEAIKHGSNINNIKPEIVWLSAEEIEEEGNKALKNLDGIIIPQGWGSRGSEGKMIAIKYCRENNVPYFGLCYGMQMAVIEFARNVAKLSDANSQEVDKKTNHPVIHIMPNQEELIKEKGYGGTIRLGAWPCKLKDNTKLQKAYLKHNRKKTVDERHRHRYEFNNEYRKQFEDLGLTIAGTSPDNKIVEAIEISDHPFFVGVQFHPEYISRPLDPHPLFAEFVRVCFENK